MVNRVCCENIRFTTKYNLYKSLVDSARQYKDESPTIREKCLRTVLQMSYREHQTSDFERKMVATPRYPYLLHSSDVSFSGLATGSGTTLF